MKYAVIGCGRISKNHVNAAKINNLDIIALCDIKKEKMDELIINNNLDKNTRKYIDYKEMISDLDLDIVSISTDSGSHFEIAIFCIENNINVIIEKPMTLNLEHADKIITLSKKKNIKVTVCHQNRFNLAIKHLKKAIVENRFGKISHAAINVRWNRNKNYYNQSSWRGTWLKDGGALMNQSIHGIDLLLWMIDDDVDEVYGVIRNQFHDYIEVEDIGLSIVKFKNGTIGSIEGTTNVFPKNLEETLYIFGEKGTVKIGGTNANKIDEWNFKVAKDIDIKLSNFDEKTKNIYGNGHIELFKNMKDAIQRDVEPDIKAEDGKKAVEIILAIYKSQKIGKPIKLPLKNFSTKKMIK